MKIIDAHLHYSNIESFRRTANEISRVDYSPEGLKTEFLSSNIVAGIGMGVVEESLGAFPDFSSANPMTLDLDEETPSFLYECVGINPVKLENESSTELMKIERELSKDRVVGIKIYAGYYHYHVYHKIYQPVYELAKAYKLPVVIHCGDTFSERGLLKYSHPLNVDEIAVANRGVNFIISHLGDPWVMDTAELVLKNSNVFADLSGLIVGDINKIESYYTKPLLMDHFKRAILYADNYSKFLFGTDWPLVPIGAYMSFVKNLVPEEYEEDIFYNNALRVFTKINL